MKLLRNVLFLTLALTFASSYTLRAQMNAATDKSLTTDFTKLKTYTWASQARSDSTNYTLNDLVLKTEIRDAIQHELAALGYEYVEGDEADFMVNFRVFDGKGEFKGYVDVYKDRNYWTSSELRKDAIGIVPDAEIRERDDMRSYYFKEGTLLIDFVDLDNYSRIWTGYASAIEDDFALDADDDDIEEVVSNIFEEYNFSAEETN